MSQVRRICKSGVIRFAPLESGFGSFSFLFKQEICNTVRLVFYSRCARMGSISYFTCT